MEAHHGCERAKLHPAHVELSPIGVVHAAITASEEATNVTVPIGNAADGKIAGRRNLGREVLPAGRHVAAPGVGPVALLSGEGRAGEYGHALARQVRITLGFQVTMMGGHAAHMGDGESVAQAAPSTPLAAHIVQVGLFPIQIVRFGGVHPISVDTLADETVVEILPIDVPRPRVIDIVWLYALVPRVAVDRDEPPQSAQFMAGLGVAPEVSPNGNHQFGILVVHMVDHLFRVAVGRVQEGQGVPLVVTAPILPVLHDAVKGHT